MHTLADQLENILSPEQMKELFITMDSLVAQREIDAFGKVSGKECNANITSYLERNIDIEPKLYLKREVE